MYYFVDSENAQIGYRMKVGDVIKVIQLTKGLGQALTYLIERGDGYRSYHHTHDPFVERATELDWITQKLEQ